MAVLFQQIAALLVKHLKGELNESESRELHDWASESAENLQLLNELTNSESLQKEVKEFYESRSNVLQKIHSRIEEEEQVTRLPQKNIWKRYVAAASILVAFSTTAYLLFQHSSSAKIVQTPTPAVQQLSDITAGGNRATLKLGNGSVISLDSVANGMLAQQGNINIVKLDNGAIAYHNANLPANEQKVSAITYNTLSTPTGGQYQLQLPDGSKAWLNAASSITYPTLFTGNERRVEITGEVYFEIAHTTTSLVTKPVPINRDGRREAAIPFIVSIKSPGGEKKGEVEVLGTHFNINAYADEPAINTTLLEGKVKVTAGPDSKSAILQPGQQAQMREKATIRVIPDANTEEVIAWKNGRFQFSSVDLSTILRQAARWYNIEVSFAGGVPADKFSGPIPRSVNLDQFLQILEMVDVHYQLEGRKLIVMKAH